MGNTDGGGGWYRRAVTELLWAEFGATKDWPAGLGTASRLLLELDYLLPKEFTSILDAAARQSQPKGGSVDAQLGHAVMAEARRLLGDETFDKLIACAAQINTPTPSGPPAGRTATQTSRFAAGAQSARTLAS
ncbi:hypothetical protein ACH4PU_30765 [Streptomyces sp. NPDC021100]|uniref:hypothetical protein n=1 Tax=Streptomyces sp. NPDC021100 TaxID=3365114 RepID=UPI0037AD49A3